MQTFRPFWGDEEGGGGGGGADLVRAISGVIQFLYLNSKMSLTLFWTGSGRTLYWTGGGAKKPPWVNSAI